MKRIRIAIVLLGTVLGLCLSAGYYQHHRIDDLLHILNRLEETYRQSEMVTAVTLAEKLAKDITAAGRIMSCYVPHEALAEGRQTAALLPGLLKIEAEDELQMELCRLREQLEHLRQIDDLNWQNVL